MEARVFLFHQMQKKHTIEFGEMVKNGSIYMKLGNEKVETIKKYLKLNNGIMETTQFKY